MKNPIGFRVCLFLLCFSAACGQDRDNKITIDEPTVVPEPDPAPVEEPKLPEATPVDGFTLKDLVSVYCTVTLLETNEEVLVGTVETSGLDDGRMWFSLYFPLNERGFVEKTSFYQRDIKSSTCDMSKLLDVKPIDLALAPIKVYADSSLKGEPVCTFPAGSTAISDASYFPASKGALPINLPSNYDCQGVTRGWLSEWPVILPVHPRR